MSSDHLSSLERKAVEAYKRHRIAAGNPSTTEEALANARAFTTATDSVVKRGTEQVLQCETDLNALLLERVECDITALRREALTATIRRDRAELLTRHTFPNKRVALSALKHKVAAVQNAAATRRLEESSSSMLQSLRAAASAADDGSSSVRGENVTSAVTARGKAADGSWQAAPGVSSETLGLLQELAPHLVPQASQLLIDEESILACALRSWQQGEERAAVGVAKREAYEAVAECTNSCGVDAMLSRWRAVASEIACLRKKLDVEQARCVPVKKARSANFGDEARLREQQSEEQRHQLELARERLEAAHRNLFQERKRMITLHRKLVQSAPQDARSAQTLEMLKNELAVGNLDSLHALCAETSLDPTGAASQAPQSERSATPAAADIKWLQAPAATANRLPRPSTGGGAAATKFMTSGTFNVPN